MKLETALAKASMDRVERRDPNKVYHKMTTAQLQDLSPAFHVERVLRHGQRPQLQQS